MTSLIECILIDYVISEVRMATKRKQQKAFTRRIIFETAKEMFLQRGFISVSTAEIAREAGVAHGTLFVHFPTREDLVLDVVDSEMEQAQRRIDGMMEESADFIKLAGKYLEFVSEHEAFYAQLAKELPFFSPEMRDKIIFRQAIVQMQFLDIMKSDFPCDRKNGTRFEDVVRHFFGMLHYYLCMKDAYNQEGSTVARFKDSLLNTIQTLLGTCKRDQP